jgi:hypothetical protein
MKNIIELFKSITGDDVDSEKSKFHKAFNQLKDQLEKRNKLDRETDQISDLITMLLINKSLSNFILSLFEENIQNVKEDDAFTEFLIYTLVETSQVEGCKLLLFKIIQDDNYYIKAYIFYHPVVYPIRKIFQTNHCKEEMITFLNSNKFKKLYINKCKMPGYHSELFAFPNQYHNCFDIKNFDPEIINEISVSKLSKLSSKERLDSIRVINDVFFKLELIKRYYSQYLPTMYKTKFIRLVDKTFPELELKKNGYDYCL